MLHALYKLFELKCVLAVCVHNPPIIIKMFVFSLSQIEPISV